jgi:hypothetical protein
MSQTKAQLIDGKSAEIEFTGGSASGPAISFTGDTNTGIYSPGADQVAVATNGGERLRITSNGELAVPGGIGPQIRFENQHSVTTDAAISTFDDASGTLLCLGSNFYFNSSGSETRYNTSEESAAVVLDRAGIINFLTGDTSLTATSRMRITSAGLVGIGTSVPNHKLHIHSTGNTPAYLRSTNDGTGTGTTDGIVIGMGDATNAYLWNYENGGIVFATNATQRAVIDSAGRVGIGTASPNYNLQVAGTDPTIAINALNASASSVSTLLYRNADGNGNPRNVASIEGESAGNGGYGALAFHTAFNDSLLERFRCDASGRLLIGTSTARSNFYNGSTDSPAFQIEGTSSNSAHASIVRNQGGEGPTLILGCSGGTSLGSNTLVSNGDRIGHINFQATDGAEFVQAANIKAEVDGTPGADDMPGRLVFSTTADGASSPTERLRIDSSGRVGIGTTTPATYLHLLGANTPARGQLSVAGNGDDARITFYRDGAFIGGINGDTTNGVAIAAETGYSITFNPGGGTERARIDSSGRLLVGTSSAIASGTEKIQAQGSLSLYDATSSIAGAGSVINFRTDGGATGAIKASISGQNDSTYSYAGRLVFSTTATGASSPTERMRIDKDGVIGLNSTATGSAETTLSIQTGGTEKCRVRGDGDLENVNNAYGAISDLKLKENIADANSQWGDLKALQVRNYNFKPETGYGTHTQIGLVAQEAELVSPGLVSESTDLDEDGNDLGTVTKSVNYSVLYMKAVKALQEAMERIETLEGMVAVNNITIDEQQHQLSTLAARLTALESA